MADLREQAWAAIAPGFTGLAEVVEAMRELVEFDPDSSVDGDTAEAVVRELWSQRRQFLATAPARRPTDDQRVTDAFAALAAAGLIAEMHCEYEQGEAGPRCRKLARQYQRGGYVFFTGQDAEDLAESPATLYLGFDAVAVGRDRFDSPAEYDAAAIAVGHQVAQTLVAHGLEVRWDGTARKRIAVVGLDWRRPLPTD